MSDDKIHHLTNVPQSAYRVCANQMLHINHAVKSIRRNDFDTQNDIMRMDPSIHNNGARKPVLFFAIKYRKSACLRAILNDPGFDNAYRMYTTAEILRWFIDYFNVDVFNTWKETKYHKEKLRWATSDPAREYATKFDKPYLSLF